MDAARQAAITRAVGDELKRARRSRGLSRPELIRRLAEAMPVNTLACYEQGIRPCSIPRLVELCEAMDMDPCDLLGAALQSTRPVDLPMIVAALDTIRTALHRYIHSDTPDDQAMLGSCSENACPTDAGTPPVESIRP